MHLAWDMQQTASYNRLSPSQSSWGIPTLAFLSSHCHRVPAWRNASRVRHRLTQWPLRTALIAVTPPQGGHHSTVRCQPCRTTAPLAAKLLRHLPAPTKVWQGIQTWAKLGTSTRAKKKGCAEKIAWELSTSRLPGELTRRMRLNPQKQLFKTTGISL